MEKLQKSLKFFNGMCARKTGIEKSLLVQEGIQKMHYSKDSVAVDFYWERFLDGGTPAAAPADLAGAVSSPALASGRKPDHMERFNTFKECSKHRSLRTARVRAANFIHNYWAVFHSGKGAVTGLQAMG